MQMLLIDKNDGSRVIDIPDELEEYYKALDCTTIDITMRKVGGRSFDIICDDEGLFDAKPIITARYRDEKFSPALVGNLIFAHHDAEGNMTALSDKDVELIQKNTVRIYDITTGENHDVVMLD